MRAFIHSFVERQTMILWITYLMYILVIPALIALAINLFKTRSYKKFCVNGKLSNTEDGFPATLFASHHSWLQRNFIAFIVMSMVSVGTLYAGVGFLLAIITIAYWMFCLIKGMLYLAAHKPMPGYYC